ncbi:uncharacterized protein MONBRDRAFT_8951 [Monosiga brevicollis MX1]|uniref:Serine/threonine-protein phosphatase 4 regulatory subunit 3-like central domain-containing protein n=1 Tax=Monosiga brevicollis TaxID=81824 RepID=A9V1L9_MONBE|nr:uncharacterized protein MONBRDRAFT_8951 [Monosiga brevicollis MX1]EDQ88590.1 predicted protein [Monosiga brevicollis MX1]|eukprot:XP_001746694.1 hypothetical protein [Monosiga brevicollis MX1]
MASSRSWLLIFAALSLVAAAGTKYKLIYNVGDLGYTKSSKGTAGVSGISFEDQVALDDETVEDIQQQVANQTGLDPNDVEVGGRVNNKGETEIVVEIVVDDEETAQNISLEEIIIKARNGSDVTVTPGDPKVEVADNDDHTTLILTIIFSILGGLLLIAAFVYSYLMYRKKQDQKEKNGIPLADQHDRPRMEPVKPIEEDPSDVVVDPNRTTRLPTNGRHIAGMRLPMKWLIPRPGARCNMERQQMWRMPWSETLTSLLSLPSKKRLQNNTPRQVQCFPLLCEVAAAVPDPWDFLADPCARIHWLGEPDDIASQRATYRWNAAANEVADPPPGGKPVEQDMGDRPLPVATPCALANMATSNEPTNTTAVAQVGKPASDNEKNSKDETQGFRVKIYNLNEQNEWVGDDTGFLRLEHAEDGLELHVQDERNPASVCSNTTLYFNLEWLTQPCVYGAQDQHELRIQACRECEITAEAIVRRGDIPKLIELFTRCEDLDDEESLAQLAIVFMSMLRMAEHTIINVLFEDEYILSFFGALEYLPKDMQRTSIPHRQYLTETCSLQEDVIMAGVIDDYLISIIDSHIRFASRDMLDLVKSDPVYLESILKATGGENNAEEVALQQAKFLDELFASVNSLAAIDVSGSDIRHELLLRAVNADFFNVVRVCLLPEQADACSSDTCVPSCCIGWGSRQIHTNGELMLEVARAFVAAATIANVQLLAQTLLFLCDTETMEEVRAKTDFLSTFYAPAGAMSILETTIDNLDEQCQSNAGQERVLCFLDFISKWIPQRMHSYHIKNYIARGNVVNKAVRVLKPKYNMLLAVGGARLLTAIVRDGNNRVFNQYIVKHDLFKDLLSRFRLNGQRDNLLTSTTLALLHYIKAENVVMLLEYLATSYRDVLESIKGSTLVWLTHLGRNLNLATSRFRQDGSMDEQEEDYFNEEDDDSDRSSNDPSRQNSSTDVSGDDTDSAPSSQRSPAFGASGPPPRPLVSYDEDDDEDDEPVFKPAVKRSKLQINLKTSA